MGDGVVSLVEPLPADDPDVVLEAAKGAFGEVMVVGYDGAGFLDVRGTLGLTAERAVFLLEAAKLLLISAAEEQG